MYAQSAMAQRSAATIVFIRSFRPRLWATGAPGSEPGTMRFASFWLFTPKGRMVNSIVHQMMKYSAVPRAQGMSHPFHPPLEGGSNRRLAVRGGGHRLL